MSPELPDPLNTHPFTVADNMGIGREHMTDSIHRSSALLS